MRPVTLETRTISAGCGTLVIAEIGVNHDGSVERAIELVHAAKAAGADAVKLQLFSAQRLMHPTAGFAGYQESRVNDATPAEMLARYELSDEGVRRIVATARSIGLLALATPFSFGDLGLIESLELPAIKIASPDLVNKPLLRACAKLGRPLLVSTGAATMDEVEMAVNWLNQWEAAFVLLHCVSSYPTPAESANLAWIGQLQRRFVALVGYSDHTTELAAGALAVAAGAVVIEKHLTLDTKAAGPDHEASFDPAQFAEYVKQIRSAEILLGKPGKRVLDIEGDVRTVSRQSLVLARPVAAGAAIEPGDLSFQRPAAGLPAMMMDQVVGRVAARNLEAGEMLQSDMLAA